MVPSIYGENMFDDFFDGSFFGGHSPLFGKHARNLMKTDIRETDDAKAYRFAVELPGFEKDEIHVDVQDGYLTVSAEKGLDTMLYTCHILIPAHPDLYRFRKSFINCRDSFQQIIGAFPLSLCAQHEDSVYICSVRDPVRDRHRIM